MADPRIILGVERGASPAELRTAADEQRRALLAAGAPAVHLAQVDAALETLLAEAEGRPPPPRAYAALPAPPPTLAASLSRPAVSPLPWGHEEPGVRLFAPYADDLSRGLLFVKWLFVIPAYIVLAFYGLAVLLTSVVALISVLVLGRYPRRLFDFAAGYLRMYTSTTMYFPAFMTDSYPLSDDLDETELTIAYPERLSRGLALVKIGALVLGWIGYAANLALLILTVVAVPIWFVILVTGRYPRPVFRVARALVEWTARLLAWQWFLRDDMPWLTASRKVSVGLGAVALVPAVLTVLSVAGTFDGPTWRWYESEDGRFAAEFPAAVQVEANSTQTLLGRVETRVALAPREDGVFLVSVHDLPASLAAGALEAQAFLAESNRLALGAQGFVIVSEAPATIAGHEGLVFTLESPSEGAFGWMQTFIAEGALYQLLVVSSGLGAFLEAERFFASFELY